MELMPQPREQIRIPSAVWMLQYTSTRRAGYHGAAGGLEAGLIPEFDLASVHDA
jgi:hypothetical protein